MSGMKINDNFFPVHCQDGGVDRGFQLSGN